MAASDYVDRLELRSMGTHKGLVAGFMRYFALRKVLATETDAARFKDKKRGNWRFSGVLPGWPDITGCHCGRFFAVEAKVGKDQLSDAQEECRKLLVGAGAYWCEGRVLEDVQRLINRIEIDCYGEITTGRNIHIDGRPEKVPPLFDGDAA